MTTYIFDLLVGYEPNGVDNSQVHRARVFDKQNIDYRYIFSVLPPRYKFRYFRELGIPLDKMIIAPFYLVGEIGVQSIISVTEMITKLSLDDKECLEKYYDNILYKVSDEHSIILWIEDDNVYEVHHLFNNELYQIDYYTSFLICREFFNKNQYGWSKRFFYNKEGSLVYEGYNIGGNVKYRFGADWKDGEEGLMELFIKSLSLSKNDTVIMDRISGFPYAQALLKYAKDTKKGVFLHSIHQFQFGRMNYEYYYLFKYAKEFDFIIVSTELQKKDLKKYLLDLKLPLCPIVVIPAASIENLVLERDEVIPLSAMIAARLDPRKQLDIAIKAAIKVRETIPQFHLNIFGKGEEYEKLNNIIIENNAQDYIKLRGYQKLSEQYKKHQLYISTASWETLGITLLEAVTNGLGIVGLDTPYGGPTFIQNGMNGYLIYENNFESKDGLIEKMAEEIINYYDLNPQMVAQYSYQIASNYLDEIVGKKWKKLIDDQENNSYGI